MRGATSSGPEVRAFCAAGVGAAAASTEHTSAQGWRTRGAHSHTTMAVTLSVLPEAREACTKALPASLRFASVAAHWRTMSTAAWSSRTSHTPSHAMMRNSLVPSSFVVVVYGSAVTYCFRVKSPKERATARTPITRLRRMKPPAASMRFTSSASSALWSRVRRTAAPLWHSTARASPQLAA